MPEGLARRLALAARLRNLLVHGYWTIDNGKVYESVRRGLSDFEDFLRCVRDFLEKRGVRAWSSSIIGYRWRVGGR